MKFTNGFNIEEKDGIIEIAEMSITYSQPADTCSNSGESQFIKVTAQNCGDGAKGWYYNISTAKWSVNEPTEIAEIINDFINRMTINTTSEEDL